MTQVLSGFAVVWVIILVGVLVGRTGVLGEHGRTVLSRAAFFIGNPALLFVTLSRADWAPCWAPSCGWPRCPRSPRPHCTSR